MTFTWAFSCNPLGRLNLPSEHLQRTTSPGLNGIPFVMIEEKPRETQPVDSIRIATSYDSAFLPHTFVRFPKVIKRYTMPLVGGLGMCPVGGYRRGFLFHASDTDRPSAHARWLSVDLTKINCGEGISSHAVCGEGTQRRGPTGGN